VSNDSKAPLVSVVMCVIDPHPVYFPEAVQSILDQTLQDLELIIIEEPSSRSASELLKCFADDRIRHFCHSHRTSLAQQRNRGIALARAALVASHDADDIAEPSRLMSQVSYMQGHPDVGVLGCQLTMMDGNGTLLGFRRYPTSTEAVMKTLTRYNPVAHPSVMYRKALVEAAGGYRQELTDDYELWIRLAKSNVRIANLPSALVRYRIHAGAMKATRLRATLRSTIELKEAAFSGRMDLRSKLRLQAEKLLMHLPAPVVLKLFTLATISRAKS
jgi:glycosyltransferase involved in cell wall biosynthesis